MIHVAVVYFRTHKATRITVVVLLKEQTHKLVKLNRDPRNKFVKIESFDF